MNHTDQLIKLGACSDAVQWADQYPSLQAAWDACEHGDWMLWLMGRTCGGIGSASRRTLVLAACACARLALPHVPAGKERPLQAIETAERWARLERGVTLDMVLAAARAAAAVADAAADAVAAVADAAAYADAAAVEALKAFPVVNASLAAAAAVAVADAVADAAAYADARTEALRTCADVVRSISPQAPTVQQMASAIRKANGEE